MSDAGYKYWAFISYSHQDKAWADWLHKRLETYRIPHRVAGREHWSGKVPTRLFPIFRDRDELPSSADLGGVLNEALKRSRYQIVICSPRSAQSRWVNEEIKFFKANGGDQRVLAFIVDGEPRVGSERECFAPALRYKLDAQGALTDERTEIIAADARKGRDGRDGALLKLIAGIVGVSFDDLKQRERQRRFWQRLQRVAIGVAAVAAIAGSWRWFENYKTTQALEARIEKLYDLGRRELLDHHEARAAVYLNEAYRLGRDTPALRFMLGQALQAVDALTDVRVKVDGQIRRSAFSPDGKAFLVAAEPTSGSNAFFATEFDAATGAKLADLEQLPPVVTSARYTPDGHRIVIDGFADLEEADARTGIWEAGTGRHVATLGGHAGRFGQALDQRGRVLVLADVPGHNGFSVYDARSLEAPRHHDCGAKVRAASVSADGLRVASGDDRGSVCIWALDGGQMIARLTGRTTSPIRAVLFSPDGERVIGFSEKGDVRVWRLENHELLLAFAADASYVYAGQIDPRSRRLVTVGSRGYRVWDLDRGTLLFEREGEGTLDSSVAVSPDGSILVIADGRRSDAQVLHLPGGAPITSLEPGGGTVGAASFSEDGRRLLLATSDGTASVFDMPVKKLVEVEHQPTIAAARFLRSQLVTAGFDGALRRWDAVDGQPLQVVPGPSPLMGIDATRDGSHVAVIAKNGTVAVLAHDLTTLLARLELGDGWGFDLVSFSNDGALFGTVPGPTSSTKTTALVGTTATGDIVHALEHPCTPHGLRFGHDGDSLITSCADGTLRRWSTRTGDLLRTFAGSGKPVRAFAVDAAGSRLASAESNADRVQVWDLLTGEPTHTCVLPSGDVAFSVAFDARGNLAIGSGFGGTIVVCDRSGAIARSMGGHASPVLALRFLGSGLLISYRADATVRVWDVARGEQVAEIANHEKVIFGIDLDAGEGRLLSAGQDGMAAVWDIAAETRSATEVTALLECRSPWRLSSDALLPNPRANCKFR